VTWGSVEAVGAVGVGAPLVDGRGGAGQCGVVAAPDLIGRNVTALSLGVTRGTVC
jgi:hypothetical protein